MALTATVSPAMKSDVMRSLSMSPDDTVVIEKIPNKPNIRYDVHVMPKNVEEILSPLITDIAEKETRAKKTIIFCRTYSDFNEISTVIISALYNCGRTSLHKIAMYARCFLPLLRKK